MGAPPDVRVRLSAEGEKQVIDAFRRIQSEAQSAGKIGSRGLNALSSSALNLGRLLPALSFTAVIAGAAYLAKQSLETGDRLAKLSQRFGIGVENLSAYSHGAQLAGVDLEDLAKAFGFLARNMEAAARGGDKQIAAFRTIGITQSELQKGTLTYDQTLGRIADWFAKAPDGWRKAAIAQDLFGRSGNRLIPFFNQGPAGLAAIKAEAEKLGLVWDTKTAKSAEAFNDNLVRLRGTVQGFVNREMAALLPLLNDLSNSLLNVADNADTAGISLGQRFALGILTGGAAIRATGGMLKDFWAGLKSGTISVLTWRKNFDEEMQHVEEIIFRTFSGPPAGPSRPRRPGIELPIVDESAQAKALAALKQLREAELALTRSELDNELALTKAHNALLAEEDQRRFEEGLLTVKAYFADRRASLESEAAQELVILKKQEEELQKRLTAEAARPLGPKELPESRVADLDKLWVDLGKIRSTIDLREIKLQGDRNALVAEEKKIVREKSTEQLKAEADLAEAQGRRFEAERLDLEATIAALKRLPGETAEAFGARQQALRQAGQAQIDFEQIQASARQAFAELETARIGIETLVQRGIISEREGQEQIALLEKDRLPILRQIAQAMEAAAVTPEQIEAARQFADQLEQLAASADLAGRRMAEFKKALDQALTSDLAEWFAEGIDNAKSFGDAMRSLAASVVQSLRQIAAQMLATIIMTQILKAVMAGVGAAAGGTIVTGAGGEVISGAGQPIAGASGGLVRGPGTSTSDSISARLSDMEYVVRAAAVKRPGMLQLLEDINSFGSLQVRPIGGPRRFATGGLVEASGQSARGPAGLKAEIDLNDALVLKRLAASREFDRVIVKSIGQNRRNVKALLR